MANNLNRKGVPLAGYILSDYGYDASEVIATVKSAYSNTNEHSKNSNPKNQKSEFEFYALSKGLNSGKPLYLLHNSNIVKNCYL
ncbi:hypothetical protein [Cloacibacterium sp.]|uniref:hypothetical protein n=1 Tax=Cloacibacterium sp. TaxID=1913682 RepID=UPI0039E44361